MSHAPPPQAPGRSPSQRPPGRTFIQGPSPANLVRGLGSKPALGPVPALTTDPHRGRALRGLTPLAVPPSHRPQRGYCGDWPCGAAGVGGTQFLGFSSESFCPDVGTPQGQKPCPLSDRRPLRAGLWPPSASWGLREVGDWTLSQVAPCWVGSEAKCALDLGLGSCWQEGSEVRPWSRPGHGEARQPDSKTPGRGGQRGVPVPQGLTAAGEAVVTTGLPAGGPHALF